MVEYGIEIIERKIREKLANELARTGLLFRLFSRVKDSTSIQDKFSRKNYSADAALMQDLIGFRITTYFYDDVKIIVDLCERLFGKVELIYDEPDTEVFKPLRKNMICRIPLDQNTIFQDIKNGNSDFDLIDNTFEIQFRTTLSEGWHEVDHLMRYKCTPDWLELTNESRMLNGIYATLETNDQALKALFDDISYLHFKGQRWEAMFRNKFRLRFTLQPLDQDILLYLDKNLLVAKEFYKVDRIAAITMYIKSTLSFPTTFDNWMYFINHVFVKDAFISSKSPEFLIEEFNLNLNTN